MVAGENGILAVGENCNELLVEEAAVNCIELAAAAGNYSEPELVVEGERGMEVANKVWEMVAVVDALHKVVEEVEVALYKAGMMVGEVNGQGEEENVPEAAAAVINRDKQAVEVSVEEAGDSEVVVEASDEAAEARCMSVEVRKILE